MATTRFRRVLDVLGEHEDGYIVYKCTIGEKTKLAKYCGMRLWLKERYEDGLLKMLDGLNWLLVEEVVERNKVSFYKNIKSFLFW